VYSVCASAALGICSFIHVGKYWDAHKIGGWVRPETIYLGLSSAVQPEHVTNIIMTSVAPNSQIT
jgi:hypothetical protein